MVSARLPAPPDFLKNPNHLPTTGASSEVRSSNALVSHGCPIAFLSLRLPLCGEDAVFQSSHGSANIVSSGLDVIRCCGAYVRVPEYSLNDHLCHAQAIQIAP